jgi:hypothetical protein
MPEFTQQRWLWLVFDLLEELTIILNQRYNTGDDEAFVARLKIKFEQILVLKEIAHRKRWRPTTTFNSRLNAVIGAIAQILIE